MRRNLQPIRPSSACKGSHVMMSRVHIFLGTEFLPLFPQQSNTTHFMSTSSLTQSSVSSHPRYQANPTSNPFVATRTKYQIIELILFLCYRLARRLHPMFDLPRSLNATWLTCDFYEAISRPHWFNSATCLHFTSRRNGPRWHTPSNRFFIHLPLT